MPLDVLIVDNSAAIRKILHRVLVQAELPLGRVLEANDGQDALKALGTNSVGLILSDINMPNMDGIEMLGKLKSSDEFRAVPIIMVTAEDSQDKVMEALDLGAAGYLRKPVTPDQIKAKIEGLV
jgi:two-component system chemotaxis response regulator CheY